MEGLIRPAGRAAETADVDYKRMCRITVRVSPFAGFIYRRGVAFKINFVRMSNTHTDFKKKVDLS